MRIANSTILMDSKRSSKVKSEETRVSIDRNYGSGGTQATLRAGTVRTSRLEMSSSSAVYHSRGSSQLNDGMVKPDQSAWESSEASATPELPDVSQTSDAPAVEQQAAVQLPVDQPNSDWLSNLAEEIYNNPKIQMLRKCLELLERCTGKQFSGGLLDSLGRRSSGLRNSYRLSASAVSMRYQQTSVLFGQQIGSIDTQLGSKGAETNGHWTRQTVRSGFTAGEEHTAFASTGTVVTADGRTLDFGISVEMSRSFTEAYQFTSKEEIFTDPLVINLDTDAAALSDVSFYFDLNCDGTAEQISGLDSASGFLALDKNGDGKINNGSELFGAQTGNGFEELAQYDQDGNGWIDENDDIFSKLSVWVQCGNGESKLLSLSEANVGAIFLGSQSTQFSLTDSTEKIGAMIRRSGVYLKESGQVGTVQHVDFKT